MAQTHSRRSSEVEYHLGMLLELEAGSGKPPKGSQILGVFKTHKEILKPLQTPPAAAAAAPRRYKWVQ